MKINELVQNFDIYTTNEEKQVLEAVHQREDYNSLDERTKFIVDNLIRKSLLIKIVTDNGVQIIKND